MSKKCMCPQCGRIIDDGELTFNLSDIIKEKMIDYARTRIMEDSELDEISDGIQLIFNMLAKEPTEEDVFQRLNNDEIGKDENPACFEEKELWETYRILNKNKDMVDFRTIAFRLPVEKLIHSRVKIKDDEHKADSFWEFLENNMDDIAQQEYPVTLRKTGAKKDNINFDRIEGYSNIKRRCPCCLSKVSHWAGRYDEITLTVLGGPRVSKSTAVVSCAAAFMETADIPDRYIRWELAKEDEGYEDFKKFYIDKYDAGENIIATKNEGQIPRISFRVRIGENESDYKYFCLTFVDVPGELNGKHYTGTRQKFNSEEQFMKKRYPDIFKNIDFVWYCTDIAEIRQLDINDLEGLGRESGPGSEKVEEALSLSEIQSNMSALNGYFNHEVKVVPVAYIIGKTDTVKISEEDKKEFGLYPEDVSADRESKLPFDVREFFFRSKKVETFMIKEGAGALVDAFNEFFADGHCYIAMSAYGFDPIKEAGSIKRPYHCKEAFYWMLALSGLIDIRAETTETQRGFLGFRRRETKVNSVKRISEFNEEQQEIIRHNLLMKGSYKI